MRFEIVIDIEFLSKLIRDFVIPRPGGDCLDYLGNLVNQINDPCISKKRSS